MNKTINIKSEQFKYNIINLINNSELPISNVYFILKFITQDVENTYYGTLNSQSAEYTKEIKLSEIPEKEQVQE